MRQARSVQLLLARFVVILSVLLGAGPAIAQISFGDVMGLALEAARQRAQAGEAAQAPASTRLSRQDVRAIQQQLNALGYDAGTPDGIMGRGTRQAIAQWQSDNGRPVTGDLAGPDRDLLFSAVPAQVPLAAAPPVGLAGNRIDRLRDTDLPLNDFRSGMRDPALKGIDVDSCEAYCAADGQCRAFTYNSQARVCFLKHSAGEPAYFRGAISGIKRDGLDAPAFNDGERLAAPAADGTRLLGPDELAELQAALNAQGYDVGRPDGKLGRRTRAAVADFLNDNPGAGSGRIDVDLLLAVTGGARGSAAAGFDTAAYQAPESAERQLALIAIAHDPQRIASDAVVLRMLQRDADRGTGPDAKATLSTYGKPMRSSGPASWRAIAMCSSRRPRTLRQIRPRSSCACASTPRPISAPSIRPPALPSTSPTAPCASASWFTAYRIWASIWSASFQTCPNPIRYRWPMPRPPANCSIVSLPAPATAMSGSLPSSPCPASARMPTSRAAPPPVSSTCRSPSGWTGCFSSPLPVATRRCSPATSSWRSSSTRPSRRVASPPMHWPSPAGLVSPRSPTVSPCRPIAPPLSSAASFPTSASAMR